MLRPPLSCGQSFPVTYGRACGGVLELEGAQSTSLGKKRVRVLGEVDVYSYDASH